jgi:hypothetical protein
MTSKEKTILYVCSGSFIAGIITLLSFPPATVLATLLGGGAGFVARKLPTLMRNGTLFFQELKSDAHTAPSNQSTPCQPESLHTLNPCEHSPTNETVAAPGPSNQGTPSLLPATIDEQNNGKSTTDPIATGATLSYIIGQDTHYARFGQTVREVVVFDTASQTARLAHFREIRVHDALKTSPVKHDFTLLWERKGAELGSRIGDKVPGAGGGGVLVAGWLAGDIIGSMTQGLQSGVKPEELIARIRGMPTVDANRFVEHIVANLEEVKSFSFSDIVRTNDATLGHTLLFGNGIENRVTYELVDAVHIPDAVRTLLAGEPRYETIVTTLKEKKRKDLIGFVIAMTIVLIVGGIVLLVALSK